jgi:hypothetical protein
MTKRQSMHWKTPSSPKLKKARQSKSKFKAMLLVIVFFDIRECLLPFGSESFVIPPAVQEHKG